MKPLSTVTSGTLRVAAVLCACLGIGVLVPSLTAQSLQGGAATAAGPTDPGWPRSYVTDSGGRLTTR